MQAVKCFGKKGGLVHVLNFFTKLRFGTESFRDLPDV